MTPTRRKFLKGTAAATFGFQFVPSHVWGANSKAQVGCIGIGGKGAADTQGAFNAGGKILGLCDVVDPRKNSKDIRIKKASPLDQYPEATFHTDYREMLEREDIDAVTISTPDHHHAHASVLAMRGGKAVYTQKPLSHSVAEARLMTKVAAETGVATQMGNQAHAGEPLRRQVELVRAGLIGKVTEVRVWTNRPIWPQGMKAYPPAEPVPEGLDWEQWMRTAPFRDFSRKIVPFVWRGWWDFGTGALGDMGCHIMDMPFWALGLDAPTSVEAKMEGGSEVSPPTSATVHYEFPAKGERPAVDFYWHEGVDQKGDGKGMTLPETVTAGWPSPLHVSRPYDGVLIGDRGRMYFKRTSNQWKFDPDIAPEEVAKVEKSIRRAPDNDNYKEWMRHILEGVPGLAAFDYSGPFTETVLLGNLAMRTGKKVIWDSATMTSPNVPEANQFVRRDYREGWEQL